MGVFTVNSNRDFILLTYYFFYSFTHGFYSLKRLIVVLGLVEVYFQKARVLLYIKSGVIIESDLAVDPCINE